MLLALEFRKRVISFLYQVRGCYMWSVWVDLLNEALVGYESCRWRHLWVIYRLSSKIEIPSFCLSSTFFHKKLYIFWISTEKYIDYIYLEIPRTSPESGNFQWITKWISSFFPTGTIFWKKLFGMLLNG